jgi:hypothetical protein
MDFQQWCDDVNGKVIGAGECWDLAEDFDKRVVNGPLLNTQVGRHPGYASDVWEGFGSNGVEAAYNQADAGSVALPGWLAIWEFGGPVTPFSHIAPTVSDHGGAVYCMSQNPGPAHFQMISKQGLLGYLVPKNGGSSSNVILAGDNKNSGSNPISDTVNTLSGLASAWTNFQRFINTPGIWNRVGIYLLGGMIVIAACVYYFKDETMNAIESVVK